MTPQERITWETRDLDPLRHLLNDLHRSDLDLYMLLIGLRDAVLGFRRSPWKEESYQRAFGAATAAGLRSLCGGQPESLAPLSPTCTLLGCEDHANRPHRLEEIATK